MVVLSVGLQVPQSTVEMAARLGVELDKSNFAVTHPFAIPSSVIEASAAACAAGSSLAESRNTLTRSVELPEEIDVTDQEPRIGVFVCNCGINISSVVDVIKEKGLNRVVVAACTPKTHEPIFQDTMQACGVNKYLFEMANIRNQDSWVHADTTEAATDKAKDLVRMSVARADTLHPLEEKKIPVVQRGLVIGGGVAGMNAALGLAEQGYEVILTEKEAELGGLANRLTATIEGAKIGDYLGELVPKVSRANEYKPTEFLYGDDPRVMTQLDLADKMEKGELDDPQTAVMVQCVGSRNEENPNCSRICCQTAIKNALHLKELNPDMNVYVLYRDIRTYGLLEDYYTKGCSFSGLMPKTHRWQNLPMETWKLPSPIMFSTASCKSAPICWY